MDKRVRSMLGLCQRAGKLVSGEVGCEKALQAGSAELVLVSGDASENTKKKFTNKTFFYKKPILIFSTKDELGAAVGKEFRAVLAVTDANFASRLIELIEQFEFVGGGHIAENKST